MAEWTQLQLAIDNVIKSMLNLQAPENEKLRSLTVEELAHERAKRIENLFYTDVAPPIVRMLPNAYMSTVVAFIHRAFKRGQSVKIWGVEFFPNGNVSEVENPVHLPKLDWVEIPNQEEYITEIIHDMVRERISKFEKGTIEHFEANLVGEYLLQKPLKPKDQGEN